MAAVHLKTSQYKLVEITLKACAVSETQKMCDLVPAS